MLLTTLSLANLPRKKCKLGGGVVSGPRARTTYEVPRALVVRREVGEFPAEAASKYHRVTVATQGRSASEAVDKALDGVNLLRGLWTLFATFGAKTFHLGSSKDEPIGVIHVGPVHTLHRPDGSRAADVFWYEPDHTGERKLFVPKKGWGEIDGHRRWALGRMSRLRFGDELQQLIRRYARALDHANLDVAFLQMWSILEKITDTIGAKYDETIERTAWVYDDRDAAKELLHHLRILRNQYVHAAVSGEQRDQAVYMIKSFVDPHLLRLIRNDFRVESIKEYGSFLSGPTDLQRLMKIRTATSRQIRFQKARADGK